MNPQQREKLACLICDYSLQLKPGELLRIRGEQAALPLIESVYRYASLQGAHPFVQMSFPQLTEEFLRVAPNPALDFVSPIEQKTIDAIDADIWILAAPEPDLTMATSAERLIRWQKGQTFITERWNERTGLREKRLRWCAVLYPTAEWAKSVGKDPEAFIDQVAQALFLHAPNPASVYRQMSRRQKLLCERMIEYDTLRIVAPGTDLTLRIGERGWCNGAGWLNLPDGEICTAPVENSASGVVTVAYPIRHQGHLMEGVQLHFVGGEVVHATATAGNDQLEQLLQTDPGARHLGEFAIGTNPALTTCAGHVLLDEKIAGTCHFALGRSIPGLGGNNTSSIHQDMVVDLRKGGRIYGDGELLYENGEFREPSPRQPLRAFWRRG